MSLLVWAGLGLLGLAGGVLILALVLPWRIMISARSEPAQMQLGLRVLGLVWWVVDTERPASGRRIRGAAVYTQRMATPKEFGRAHILRMLRAVPALIGGVLARVRVEVLEGRVKFGLGDPADTGQVYGYVVPISLALYPRVEVIADFTRACLVGEGRCVVAVVPIRVLPVLLRFGWASFGPQR